MEGISRDKLGIELRKRVQGEVVTEEKALARYSTDQSIYQIWPLAAVIPAGLEDVVAVVNFAHENGLSLTPRGGGSSTAGSALGSGVVLAFRRNGPLGRIIGLEETGGEAHVTVEPALLHDDLQRFLRDRGLFLPADPSSGNLCLLGSNVATKASGPHAFKHGSIDRYLRRLQFVTALGEVVDTADERTIPDRIRRGVLAAHAAVQADGQAISWLRARQGMKLASGYNLLTLVRDEALSDFVAQLLVGSVGTLGVITEITLRAEPYEAGRSMTLLYFRHLDQAGDAVLRLKELDVAAIELIGHQAIAIVRQRSPGLAVPEGEAHMLIVEYEGPRRDEQMARVEQVVREQGYDLAWPPVAQDGAEEQTAIWKVRKSILPTLLGYSREIKALSLVNDVGVKEEHLAALIRDVEAIFRRHNLMAAIYGHAGSGNLHLRPFFNIHDPNLRALLKQVADEVYAAVFDYGGTITAEHGMGRVRAPYLAGEWGETMVGYMRQIKQAFDPLGLLNPGAMFPVQGLTDNLRKWG